MKAGLREIVDGLGWVEGHVSIEAAGIDISLATCLSDQHDA
jgi:hypothetical protein